MQKGNFREEEKKNKFTGNKRRADDEMPEPKKGYMNGGISEQENKNFGYGNSGQNNRSENTYLNRNNVGGNGSNNIQSNQNNDRNNNTNHNNRNIHVQPTTAKELPIAKYQDEIIKSIDKNQVIIIAGETGCGKTTQVPQYIYKGLKEKDQNVNILITQPRRIAAFSIAKRLSYEMNVTLGEEVGYHVGMSPIFRQDLTRILIMTTGIFLQRLIHEKNLDEYTHVILDEVHERDIDIDFVLVLMKHILYQNKKIKLILMSATISTHLFANYFSESSVTCIDQRDYYEKEKNNKEKEFDNLNKSLNSSQIFSNNKPEMTWTWGQEEEYQVSRNQTNEKEIFTVSNDSNNKNEKKIIVPEKDAAPIISIKEKIYPVQTFYLDTFIQNLSHSLRRDFSSYKTNFDKKMPKIDSNLYEICYYLVLAIHDNHVYQENGRRFHVLVFLPGFGEIETMFQMLLSKLSDKNMGEMEILKLHSNLNDDEQQKVFYETPKRKVILSTNIAESSITINDIYYVIDFCLVKELKVNIKTSHESLDLNWSSKASGNQRAGRAGRVGAGYVFRLVPQSLFEQLNDFSHPEILRVPLEKVILRVKVLDYGEPEVILGRALEPPCLKHIETAINNLQNSGALTLATQKSPTGELTELGKVYSEMPIDIKYSRLIMLAYAFDMLDPAIVIASVLVQEKGIFKKNQPDFNSRSFSHRNYFANNTGSDMIAYYNAFKSWEAEFGHELHSNEFSRRINHRNKMDGNFCKQFKLDPKILREVLQLCADIKMRLKKLNLLNDQMSKKVDFNDENNVTIFKFLLAGAFYGHLAKSQYADIEKLKKLKASKSLKYKLKQSVFLKTIPMEVPEQVLKDFANSTGPINNLERYGEDVLMEFEDKDYSNSIKKILTLGSNYKPRDVGFGFHFTDNQRRQPTFMNLKRPEYPFEVKMYDIFSSVQVEMDYYSCNHVVIEDKEEKVPNMFFVYEDIHQKSGKYIAKHSSVMPNIPMLDIIVLLIFTPRATFFANEGKNQYESFRTVGSEIEFRFTHLFAGSDVKEINNIRMLLNEIIANKNLDYSIIKDKRELLRNSVFKLLNKQRIKIIANEDWWNLFYYFYREQKEKKEAMYRQTSELMKIQLDENTKGMTVENEEEEEIMLYPQVIGFDNYKPDQNVRVIDKKSNDFLPPLNVLEIQEDFRLWTEAGLAELSSEKQMFEEMREIVIKKISENKKWIYTDKAEIACGLCNSYLCAAKNLKIVYPKENRTDDNDFYCFSLSGWISGFVNLLPIDDPAIENSDFVERFKTELELSPKLKNWVACKTNNHIIGFMMDDVYFVTKHSNLRVLFPTTTSKKFEQKYWENNFALLFKEEKEYLTKRYNQIKKGLRCHVCERDYYTGDDYVHHIDKDLNHKKRMNELLEEIF